MTNINIIELVQEIYLLQLCKKIIKMEILLEKLNKVVKHNLSETGTIVHIILPIFDFLEWKIGVCENIIFEEKTETNRRVDIKFQTSKNSFLLEAKKLNKKLELKDFEQLTTYLNGDTKTDIGILTNGLDFWIADNRKKGGYSNKNIYKFSLNSFTNCDLKILRCFRFPLENLKNLEKIITHQNIEKEIYDLKCIPIQTKNRNIKVNKKNILDDFYKIDISSFNNNFTKYFTQKVEIGLTILEMENKNIDDLFSKFGKLFRTEKPKYQNRYLNKYNIYIYLNTNTESKKLNLEKFEKYLIEKVGNI